MAGVVVVAVDVVQLRRQLGEGVLVDAAVVLEAVAGAFAQLFDGPAGAGHADHRHVELAARDHGLQRGEDLLVREIAGGAEEHECVGSGSQAGSSPGRCTPHANGERVNNGSSSRGRSARVLPVIRRSGGSPRLANHTAKPDIPCGSGFSRELSEVAGRPKLAAEAAPTRVKRSRLPSLLQRRALQRSALQELSYTCSNSAAVALAAAGRGRHRTRCAAIRPSVASAASMRGSSGWPQFSRRQLPKPRLAENIGPGATLMPSASACRCSRSASTACGSSIHRK